jgi:hypothetical protein
MMGHAQIFLKILARIQQDLPIVTTLNPPLFSLVNTIEGTIRKTSYYFSITIFPAAFNEKMRKNASLFMGFVDNGEVLEKPKHLVEFRK